MRTQKISRLFATLLLLSGTLALVGPVGAVEDGLMGVRIGASYREVVRKFGHPIGILMNAGGGMTYQALPAGRLSAADPAGSGPLPVWAQPVQVAFLGDQQAQWLYDLRRTRGVTLGIVMSGEGADAVVTDVILSGYPEYLKGKKAPVRTEKGVAFQSTFATVLQKYGFPPQIEIFTPGSAPAPIAAGATRQVGPRAGGGGPGGPGGMRGMRGRGRGGGMNNMGGGARGLPSGDQLARTSSYQLELTQMGGAGDVIGGMPGRRGRGGRGNMGRGAPGARGLPPLGTAAAGPAVSAVSGLTASTMVDGQSISFSKDCILTYKGISFTLHAMRVIRIHVSE